jgi:hypothetical protein
LVFITVVESVYSAVRTDSLYKANWVSSLKRLTLNLCLEQCAGVRYRAALSLDMLKVLCGCNIH